MNTLRNLEKHEKHINFCFTSGHQSMTNSFEIFKQKVNIYYRARIKDMIKNLPQYTSNLYLRYTNFAQEVTTAIFQKTKQEKDEMSKNAKLQTLSENQLNNHD